jgi:hypothetical protein
MKQNIERIGHYIGGHPWLLVVLGFLAFLLVASVLPHIKYEAMPPLDPSTWIWI